MSGVDVAIASFEADAEAEERYLVANRDRTCGECGNWTRCPCGCAWGTCPHVEALGFDDPLVSEDTRAVHDYECMRFSRRED